MQPVDEQNDKRRRIVATTKRVLIGVSITFVAVMLYQWGHLDGREGRTSGLIGECVRR